MIGNKKYDWVFQHLKSRFMLEASPYLWTRIKANLESGEIARGDRGNFLSEGILSLRWALPFLLVISVSFAVFIGVKLSRDFDKFVQNPDKFYTYEVQEPDSDFLMDENLFNNAPKLKPESESE